MSSLDNYNVVKSNHLVNAGYRLSLDEQRIILACIAQLDSRRPTQKERIRVYVNDYAQTYGLSSKNAYAQLKKAVNTLYERSIDHIEGKEVVSTRWISQKGLYHDGEGYISLRFSMEIEPYLFQLHKQFTKYKLKQVALLKRPHSIRILELMLSYNDKWCVICVDELKKILGFEDKYPRFSEFKRWVLDTAQEELKEKSGIKFTFEVTKRIKRAPVTLRFEWEDMADTLATDSDRCPNTVDLINGKEDSEMTV